MNKSEITLLRMLLTASSPFNTLKYGKDKKKRGTAVGQIVANIILFLILAGYEVATAVGYAYNGMTKSIAILCGITVSVMAFVLTFFRIDGTLFDFDGYDILMSFPYKAGSVAKCKCIYLYVRCLHWYLGLSLAGMVVALAYGGIDILGAILWTIMSLFLPLIPMLAATVAGTVITGITSGFKNKTILRAAASMTFILLVFAGRFLLEGKLREEEPSMSEILASMSEYTDRIARYYPPVKWFSDGTVGNIASCILLVIVSLVLFVSVFFVVGKRYRELNSALKSHSSSKDFVMKSSGKRSVLSAVVFKEYRRFMGSSTYLVNCGFGVVLSLVIGIAVMVVGFDGLISTITGDAPIPQGIVYPAIPFIVYFCTGMVSTTTCSPSLEGKSYWIVQSLPLDRKKLYQGKLIFNMILFAPVGTLVTMLMCIAAHTGLINTLICMLLSIALIFFSSSWGLVCGIRFMKLQWESEIEVIKQGTAVVVYMLPNMFVNMGLIVLMIFLGTKVSANILLGGVLIIVAALGLAAYKRAMRLAVIRG
ncbi:ABC-2 type transport system permease protein [Oscillospiraceae bacterium]|nr:ABC-2 type transport system permease protein [Oscillospiraceae bacterium]